MLQFLNILQTDSSFIIESCETLKFLLYFYHPRLFELFLSEGYYAVVSLPKAVIYFGGFYNNQVNNEIYRYAGGTTWSKLGNLKVARHQ